MHSPLRERRRRSLRSTFKFWWRHPGAQVWDAEAAEGTRLAGKKAPMKRAWWCRGQVCAGNGRDGAPSQPGS